MAVVVRLFLSAFFAFFFVEAAQIVVSTVLNFYIVVKKELYVLNNLLAVF